MIYSGPGFLADSALLFPQRGPIAFLVSKLSLFLSLPVCRWSSLLTGVDGGVGWDEEPNHTTVEKALSSINRSILSGRRRWRTACNS